MDQERLDYVDPEPPARRPEWLRELAAVLLFLALVECDLALRARLPPGPPPSVTYDAEQVMPCNW